jgi:myo-inositol-1-phosphate synthase
VTSQFDVPLAPENVHVGPERSRAVADGPQVGADPHGRGRAFGGVPLNVELKLEVGTRRTRQGS